MYMCMFVNRRTNETQLENCITTTIIFMRLENIGYYAIALNTQGCYPKFYFRYYRAVQNIKNQIKFYINLDKSDCINQINMNPVIYFLSSSKI